MTRKELPARAANIQRAIATTSTCTPATVEYLRTFLHPVEMPATIAKENPVTAAPTRERASLRVKAGGRGAKKQTRVAILEVPSEKVDLSNTQERHTLAIEIVNLILKALSDAIKNPQNKTRKPPLKRTSSSASFGIGRESRSQTPLQPICVNRRTDLSAQKDKKPRNSSTASDNERYVGLRSQAECGRIAFATLRLLQGQEGSPSMPYLQLESGMSALIGRLITLGFHDIAVKELRILGRRLEAPKKISSESIAMVSIARPVREDRTQHTVPTLVDILRLSNCDANGQLSSLIITTQLQIFRVLAARKDARMAEDSLQHLRLDVVHSPANTIQLQIDYGSRASCDKAAQQLESLAQSIIALCPSLSAAEDSAISRSSNSLPAHIAFEFQMLAFQIRSVWWKLSGHQVEITTDVIDPFSRCLAAFHRRSKMESKDKYQFAMKAFDVVTDYANAAENGQKKKLLTVYQLLADLAQEGSQHLKAIQWLQRSVNISKDCNISQTRSCTLSCRLASLQIRASDSSLGEEVLDSLSLAATNLAGNLQGDSSDLDDLLIHVARLRRSSFSMFQDFHRPCKNNLKKDHSPLLDKCSEIVLLSLKFVLRYIGSDCTGHGNEKTEARRQQRRRLAAQVSNPMIESVAAMARLSAKTTNDNWVVIQAGLRDSASLALILEDIQDENRQASSEDKQCDSSFVSLSNAYWYRYLHLKHEPNSSERTRECLQMSIDLIKCKTPREQRAGFLPMKIEKYAQLCESMRDYRRATEAYQVALQTQINLGLLQVAAKAADTKSLPHALNGESDLAPLFKALLAYPRAAAKATIQGARVSTFFDDERSCTEERGLLLELQLIALLLVFQDLGPSPSIVQAINALSRILLSLYTDEEYPVRHLRIVIRLLGFMSSTSDVLDEGLKDLLIKTPSNSRDTHSDMALLQYLPHLSTTHDVLVSLCQKSLEVGKIEPILALWSKMVYDHPDWESLQMQVFDISEWLSQLEAIADFLDMRGLELTRVSVLHIIVTVHEAAESFQCSALVSKLSALGLQYVRLGYSGAAATAFHSAQRYLETSQMSAKVAIRWHLGHAEHTIANGNLKACRDDLDKAKVLLHEAITSKTIQTTGSKDQSDFSQLVADAYSLHAKLASAEGQSSKALYCAQLAMKSTRRSWAILDKIRSRSERACHTGKDDMVNEAPVEPSSDPPLGKCRPAEPPTAHAALHGAAFWSLVPKLFQKFIHLSQIYAHHGLYTELCYYLNQAQRIAEAVRSPSLLARQSLIKGQYSVLGGELVEGLKSYQDAETLLSSLPHDIYFIQLKLSMAEYNAKHYNDQSTHSGISIAEQTIHRLMTKSFLDGLIHKQSALDDLASHLGALKVGAAEPARQSSIKARRAVPKKTASSKSNLQRAVHSLSTEEVPCIEAITLNRMKGEVFRGKAMIAIREGSLDLAASHLEKAECLPGDQQSIVVQALLASQVQHLQGLEHLASDPVFCVLPESTISCPSIKGNNERQQQTSHSCKRPARAVPSKVQRGKGSVLKTPHRSPSTYKSEDDLLRLAQTRLNDVHKLAKKYSATNALHNITTLLGETSMMLSATSSSASKSLVSAAFLVYILEAGRLLSMARETTAIYVDQRMSQDMITYEWPQDEADDDHGNDHSHQDLEFPTFQAEYIDIIPENWTAISMTLSESGEEILLCRMRSGQSPFILRLPLSRSDALEPDEESFTFAHGKAELQDIIRLTNKSTHRALDVSKKGAKTEWWEARNALDARLKDLLTDVERIWLGGFKGVFCQQVRDESLLARFQQSLQNILDKYLPSRQKSGRGNQSGRVNLDPRVIELFVGLSNPSETHDIDEPLRDLLYFIIDILQFNGERNAYDEVDLDSIAMETTDALRQYHMAVDKESLSKQEQHTILILDKHLHCFPWESLPCLSGNAVSRLPSLGCLRDRIMLQRTNHGQQEIQPSLNDKFFLDRRDGVSVINPGGDLTSTQSKFEEPLQELPGWDSVVQREPTETEMKDFLGSREIMLYFGHGSGSQYIRPRTIKKLDRCAVALLMGCSSGALNEVGEFEAYGTPIDYMHAGSPAVLATLWDVTDKDIDRFSQTVLEKWGLFEKARSPVISSPIKRSTKPKGKGKVQDVQAMDNPGDTHVSLDEAVALGRNSCVLKYLNGAAPVVYGIPVFLA